MFTPPIQDILAKRLQQVPELISAPSLKQDIDELVARHISSGKVAVIDDARTSTAYGDQVFHALKGRFEATHITIAGMAKADEATLLEIETKSRSADLLIAVGSGTINDLVKLATYRAKKPYLLFPTAASMNGYVSKTASIEIKGHKQSIAAALPLAVFMDMGTIVAAPTRLTQAGLGDSLARSTAQADWLLSHHLLGIPYDDAPYQLIAPYESPAFEQAKGLLRGDAQSIEALMKLLLVSGFGMTIAESSTPASGAEHMIAHILSNPNNLHGEEIAYTSIDMAMRQEKLLAQSKIKLCATDKKENEGYTKKREKILETFPDLQIPQATWEKAREAIAAIHLSSDTLKKIAAQAALPDSPVKLGWGEEQYKEARSTARFTRDRFTCLDVEAA